MANSVYEVNHETRLVMPDTEWSYKVLGSLVCKGHTVIKVGGGDLVAKVEAERTPEELDRRDILIAETGY